MSISAQQAAQELRKLLVDFLPDRYTPYYLNKRLVEDLRACCFPESPGNFEDACIFFREFFAEISHPNIVSFGWGASRGPIVFGNILFAIKKYGNRLRAFRRILIKTCEEHCQYEALFAVMCEALHHPVGYYERYNSQNCRDFLLKGMMMVRIEQRRRFPPGPNCKLTYLFHFSLDDILDMMKRKHGMSGHEETRRQMERSLETCNTYQNEKYSGPIRRLLQEKPNFFLYFKSDLEFLSRYIIREAIKESFWLNLMHTMTFKLYEALCKAGIVHENKTWIIYWCIQHLHSHPIKSRESFNDMMTRIVQPRQMAFPFREHPRLFKTNSGIFRAALNCESVPTSDLLEICYRSHVKSQYGQIPSKCVIAGFVRRKLYEVKMTKAVVKIQKMARRSLWHFYLKRLIAAMIIKQRVLRVVTPILQLKRAKSLIMSAVKRIFNQSVYFEKLDTYRYIQQIKAGCVIFKVLNRHNHVREYQKIRAGSIIQSRLIALFERQKVDKRIERLKAASALSRFAKVKRAENVHTNLQKDYARSIIQSRLIALFERQRSNPRIERLKAASTLSRFAKVKRAEIVHTNLQKDYARSIIQSRLIALFERQRSNAKIVLLKAASTLSRFAKVQRAKNVRERLQNFVKDLSCYDCPLCFEELSSVPIGMIQPCGHIHCKACFEQIGAKCSCCRAEIIQSDCKSVGTFLSKSNPKFFFTRVNPDKKTAIEVIGWTIKRRLVAQN
jgi:hypothetical protein